MSRNVVFGGYIMMENGGWCWRRVRDLLGVLLAGVSLAGCIDPNSPVGRVAGPCLGGGGTLVQDTFLVSVKDVSWTDRVMRAGMEYVPEAQRAMHGGQAYLRPQAEFLVIDLEIENAAGQTNVLGQQLRQLRKILQANQ
jgi:hypothetical protein